MSKLNQYPRARTILYSLIVLSSDLLSPTVTYSKPIQEDIRIDVPLDAQVQVENRFGNVSVEVWGNKYVSVSASVEGSSLRFGRPPIVIDNRGKLLSISAVQSPVNPVTAIHLALRVPDASHVEITTTSGRITMRGLTASASLRSRSGDIEAILPAPLSANINARSAGGLIKSELGTNTTNQGHALQARLGNASRYLLAENETGQILLSAEESAADRKEPEQPELIGTNRNSKAAGTPASQTESGEVSEGDVVRVDSQLVNINMNVIDRGTNRGLAGLTQSDFRLFEDGQEQRIAQFESSAAPFDLVLLIDLSGSTREVVNLIRSAALRFIETARPSDRIAVITFAGEATIVSSLTADRELLRRRVNTMETARGDTKLYDATDFAINEVMKESKKSRRSAIVLMSDGLDGTIPGVNGQRGSQHSYREVLSHIQEFDGVLYTLWVNTEYEALNMKEMADTGGGVFYEVESLADLAGAYEQVVNDLGTVYSLAYRPSNKTRDGKWRAIRIDVSRPNAVPRGKRGYYAN
jgi:Ca-activated chloride channel homolog